MGLDPAVVVQQQGASKGAGLVVGMSGYAEKFEHSFPGRVTQVPGEDDLLPPSYRLQRSSFILVIPTEVAAATGGGTCCSVFFHSRSGLPPNPPSDTHHRA